MERQLGAVKNRSTFAKVERFLHLNLVVFRSTKFASAAVAVLFRHGSAIVFTAAAPIISHYTPPPSHPFTLHHDSIPPRRPHRLIAAEAPCHRHESPLPAGKTCAANCFGHLFRHGTTLLHLLRRRRLRPPDAVLIQPRFWLQGLADAPNYVPPLITNSACGRIPR